VLHFQAQPAAPWTRTVKVVRTALINIIVLVMLFALGEGFLSVALLASDMLREDVTPERTHTRYDPELGWAPIPNLDLPSMYGPGSYLRTNSQGFRGTYDYTETPPPGKRRVICSGDSVTFGYGVDDEHSWCRLLETVDPRLETINMGLPGYGVDQAYLWYKRDAGRFDHQVHLFAPITDDFRRMQSTRFLNYDRPFLAVEDGRLQVTNVPVPERSFKLPWWNEARRHLWSLRSAQAVRRLDQSVSESQGAGAVLPASLGKPGKLAADRQTAGVVSVLLRDLQALNEERGSILVVVYLPTHNDRGLDTAFWIGLLEDECKALGIPFVNLVKDFEQMPDHEAIRLYLPDLGHFNRDGNAYVARRIHQYLAGFPEVSRALFRPDGRQARNRVGLE
jgi:lysophospholipase L1-like esterase